VEALAFRLQEQETSVAAGIRSLVATLERGNRLVELYTLQEEIAPFDYESGLVDYELGRITGKELLDRKLTLEDIQLSMHSSVIENNTTLLELYALTGRDLFQWLNTVAEE